MIDRLKAAIVPEQGSIRDAMLAVDHGAGQIALAVDDQGRLVGVATDGDLRRALLQGVSLDDPLGPVLTRRFVAVTSREGRAEAVELMRAHRIAAVPALDAAGIPVGLHLLQEFLQPTQRSNWAVIMAGGQGVRLRPLTDTVPKPMLRVAGRPILERIVLHLMGVGITRIFISINYLGDVIEGHFGNGAALGCSIEYLREDKPLGTAGALGLLPEAPTQTILLMNGDLVTSADLGSLLDFHARGHFAATVGTRRYLHSIPFACVVRDGDRLVQLEEKPTLERQVNTGIYALEPHVVSLVAPGEAITTPDLITTLLQRGDSVGAFEIEDDWIDVGQREQLASARDGA